MSKDSKMDLNEMELLVSKIKTSVHDEEIFLMEIKNCLSSIGDFYKSSTAMQLQEANETFGNSFENILENRRAYIRTLQSTINNYEDTAKKTVKAFQNIQKLESEK